MIIKKVKFIFFFPLLSDSIYGWNIPYELRKSCSAPLSAGFVLTSLFYYYFKFLMQSKLDTKSLLVIPVAVPCLFTIKFKTFNFTPFIGSSYFNLFL